MKAILERLDESVDKKKIKLETENIGENEEFANIIRRLGIRFLDFQSVQVSMKMTPPADENSPMKLEIVL